MQSQMEEQGFFLVVMAGTHWSSLLVIIDDQMMNCWWFQTEINDIMTVESTDLFNIGITNESGDDDSTMRSWKNS